MARDGFVRANGSLERLQLKEIGRVALKLIFEADENRKTPDRE